MSRGRQRGVPLEAFLKENGAAKEEEEDDNARFYDASRIDAFNNNFGDGDDDDDEEEEEEEEAESDEDDRRRGRARDGATGRRRGGRHNRRRYDEEEDEENRRSLPPPRHTLEETRNVVARASVEYVSSSLTGEMPSAEAMNKLERTLQKCVQAQKAAPEDDVKRKRLLKKLETLLQQRFDAVTIDPFGSFVSAFHTKNSDIDVSLTIHPSSQWYNEEEERKYETRRVARPGQRETKGKRIGRRECSCWRNLRAS